MHPQLLLLNIIYFCSLTILLIVYIITLVSCIIVKTYCLSAKTISKWLTIADYINKTFIYRSNANLFTVPRPNC